MKKKILDGQPLYMAQYSGLMIILLAFFIVMQSMSSMKESGFKSGMGEVKNAFGLSGGLGIFQFIVPGRGGSSVPNPSGTGDQSKAGIHENLVKGEGGSGNTEADAKKSPPGRYLQVEVPIVFEKYKSNLVESECKKLDKFSVGLILYDYRIMIKCFANDYRDKDKDSYLATQRAANIMRYIHEAAQIPYSRLEALGNSSIRYYSNMREGSVPEQESFFFIYERPDGRKQ